MAPDLFSFGPFFISAFLGYDTLPSFAAGPPPESSIPGYVHALYPWTHSAVIFSLVFFSAWLPYRRPVWPMAAWGLHILYDIPLHSRDFFPTPFLWPLSSYTVNGWLWGSPWIFFPNLALLATLYVLFFICRRRHAPQNA